MSEVGCQKTEKTTATSVILNLFQNLRCRNKARSRNKFGMTLFGMTIILISFNYYLLFGLHRRQFSLLNKFEERQKTDHRFGAIPGAR